MLKINPQPTFWGDVKLTVPGEAKPGTISLEFKYRTKSELKDLMALECEDFELVSDIVVGWKGADVDFTVDNLKLLLENYPASAIEITTEYYRLNAGSRIKN